MNKFGECVKLSLILIIVFCFIVVRSFWQYFCRKGICFCLKLTRDIIQGRIFIFAVTLYLTASIIWPRISTKLKLHLENQKVIYWESYSDIGFSKSHSESNQPFGNMMHRSTKANYDMFDAKHKRTTHQNNDAPGSTNIISKSKLNLKAEEIFQLEAPLPFLPGYKNPCFRVKVDLDCQTNLTTPASCQNASSRIGMTRIACLPYFFLIGFPKCGTTDLCQWLHKHQDIRKPKQKELHFWDNLKRIHLFSGYVLAGFSSLSTEINRRIRQNFETGKDGYYPVITGECTPRTAWAAGAHHAIQGPGGLPSMNVSDHHQLTPYRIAHVLPHLKIIVIMRNPIERLWSHYCYDMEREKQNVQDFHKIVTRGIQWMENCTIHKKLPLRVCSYGSNFYHTYDLPNLQDGWLTKYGIVYKMRIGMYHVFLEDWLKVFPKENFIFVQFDDYVKHPQRYVAQEVVPHLGLDPYTPTILANVQKLKKVGNMNMEKPPISNILPKTVNLLKKFYRPHNSELASLLHDTRYLLWND